MLKADFGAVVRPLPASQAGAPALWAERMDTVRRANSLEPLERWFTDAFRQRRPGRWKQIRDTSRQPRQPGISGARRRS
jgi:hypothetical protein